MRRKKTWIKDMTIGDVEAAVLAVVEDKQLAAVLVESEGIVSAWELLWETSEGDFYAGREAALYRDGELVWNGASNDAAEDILRTVLGDELSVRHFPAPPRLNWPNRLDALLEPPYSEGDTP